MNRKQLTHAYKMCKAGYTLQHVAEKYGVSPYELRLLLDARCLEQCAGKTIEKLLSNTNQKVGA